MPQRRDFLGWLGASAVLSAAGRPLFAEAPAPSAGGRRHPQPVSTDWDLTWVDRVNGAHRAVFDVTQVGEGAGVFRSIVWRKQYQRVYGVGPEELSAVVVIRHEAIPLIMGDDYWNRFNLAKEHKIKDEKGKYVKGNPVRTAPEGVPPQFADFNLESLLKAGGVVLACNMAFGDIVERIAKADKVDPKEATARAKGQIIPGIILQPSGVFAVLRAQEAGCNYIMAS
jgi:hypothetical protein